MPNLKTLQLDNNQILRVDYDTFMCLTKLEKLYLDYNKITTLSLSDDAFINLVSLEELELGYNKLNYMKQNVLQVLSIGSCLSRIKLIS